MTTVPQRPLATRRQAVRLLRPHLVPLGALAVAADRSAAQLIAAMLRQSDQARYDPKIRGLLVAVAWSEAVREWVQEAQPPNVRLYTPHQWTELLIGELHVRIQRDNDRPLTERRRRRNQQFPDPTLPFAITVDGATIPDDVTNIDVEALLSADNRVRGIRAVAPLGKGYAWSAINVGMQQMIQQLTSWQRREVPWLQTIRQLSAIALIDDARAQRDYLSTLVRAQDRQLAELRAVVVDLQQRLLASEPDQGRLPDSAPPSALPRIGDPGARPAPRFRTPPKDQGDAARPTDTGS